MQQQPPADKVDGHTAEGEHQLSEQYQPDEAYVLVLDAHVDDGLREERQDELLQTAHDKPKYYLSEIALVLLHIAEEKTERPWILILFTLTVFLVGKKLGVGSRNIAMPFSSPLDRIADPRTLELLKIVLYKTFTRVGNIELPVPF